MNYYDLRSDTVTRPVTGMCAAMANAAVGDDVYQEDPSVNALQEMAAQLTGKESALFVTSGSMGNLIALYLVAGRGTEVIAHAQSHIIQHEIGAIASIAGALPIGVHTKRGLLRSEDVEPLIKPIAYDLAKTAMIEVENTIGGICYPLSWLKELRALADRYHLYIHMDGARIFNASVASHVPVRSLAESADTVSFCLSKGLGAPVGSLLCGTKEFVDQARRIRKMLGGGMRQAGILAAAGMYALEHHVERLEEDHRHAQQIAITLHTTGWATLDLEDVETNMIFFSVANVPSSTVTTVLQRHGILSLAADNRVRLVTHLDISEQDTEEICTILSRIKAKEFFA